MASSARMEIDEVLRHFEADRSVPGTDSVPAGGW